MAGALQYVALREKSWFGICTTPEDPQFPIWSDTLFTYTHIEYGHQTRVLLVVQPLRQNV